MQELAKTGKWTRGFDARDRWVISLYAQLKAEQHTTRETLEWVVRNGTLKPKVLEAIAIDPVRAASSDLVVIECTIVLDDRSGYPPS